MRRGLILLLVLVPLLFIPASSTARVSLFSSVRPLYSNTFGENICTTSALAYNTHLWLTAAHCLVDDTLFIDGSEALKYKVDAEHDLAVLWVGSVSSLVRGLKLADRAPKVQETVEAAGYPYGDGPFYTLGYIMNVALSLKYYEPTRQYMFYSLNGCPGNSGSPVVDSDGELVSVWQIGYNAAQRACGGPAGGATYSDLKTFLQNLLPGEID